MQTVTRIPKLSGTTFDSALTWFFQLHCNGFLFHPEDDPASIFSIADGENMFSENEVCKLRLAISEMESSIGHDAINKYAYPIFMNDAGIRLDA